MPMKVFVLTSVGFYLQEKEGCHSSLYTLKWFMQCFLDRVCSSAASFVSFFLLLLDATFANIQCVLHGISSSRNGKFYFYRALLHDLWQQ